MLTSICFYDDISPKWLEKVLMLCSCKMKYAVDHKLLFMASELVVMCHGGALLTTPAGKSLCNPLAAGSNEDEFQLFFMPPCRRQDFRLFICPSARTSVHTSVCPIFVHVISQERCEEISLD